MRARLVNTALLKMLENGVIEWKDNLPENGITFKGNIEKNHYNYRRSDDKYTECAKEDYKLRTYYNDEHIGNFEQYFTYQNTNETKFIACLSAYIVTCYTYLSFDNTLFYFETSLFQIDSNSKYMQYIKEIVKTIHLPSIARSFYVWHDGLNYKFETLLGIGFKELEKYRSITYLLKAGELLEEECKTNSLKDVSSKEYISINQNIYQLTLIVQTLIQDQTINFADEFKYIVKLARKIKEAISSNANSKISKPDDLYAIKAVVEEYLIDNLDSEVLDHFPGAMFLPNAKSIKNYYENFSRNNSRYKHNIPDFVVSYWMRNFKDTIAKIIVHHASEEEIRTAYLKYGNFDSFDSLLTVIYQLIDNLDSTKEEDATRAKILYSLLLEYNKFCASIRSGQKEFQLLKFLNLIEYQIVDIANLQENELIFLAQKIDTFPDALSSKKTYISNVIDRIIEVLPKLINSNGKISKGYENLVIHIAHLRPEILETYYIDEDLLDIDNISDHLLKNKKYLNSKLYKVKEEDDIKENPVYKLLQSKGFSKEYISKLNDYNFVKVVNALFQAEFDKIGNNPNRLNEFRNQESVRNFQPSVKERFQQIIKNSKSDSKIRLCLYKLNSDEELRKEMEDLIVKNDHTEEIKTILIFNPTKFLSLPVEKLSRLISNRENDSETLDPWMVNILKDPKHISSNPSLIDSLANYLLKNEKSFIDFLRYLNEDDKIKNELKTWGPVIATMAKLFDKKHSNYQQFTNYSWFKSIILETQSINSLIKSKVSNVIHDLYNDGKIPENEKGNVVFYLCSNLNSFRLFDQEIKSLAEYFYHSINSIKDLRNSRILDILKNNNDIFIQAGFTYTKLDHFKILHKNNKNKLEQEKSITNVNKQDVYYGQDDSKSDANDSALQQVKEQEVKANGDLNALELTIKAKNQELDSCAEELDKNSEAIDSKEEELANIRENIKTKQAELKTLEVKLDTAKKNNEDRERKLESLATQIQEGTNELSQFTQNISNLRQSIKLSKEQQNKLISDLKNFDRKLEQSTKALENNQNQIDTKTQQLNAIQKDIEIKEVESQKLNTKLANLDNSLNDGKKECESIQEKISDKQNELTFLNKLLDETRKKLDELEKNVEKQNEELKSLTERQDKIQKEIDNNTKKLGELEKDIKSKEDESQLINDNSVKLQSDIKAQNDNLASLTQQIANKNTELEQATEKLKEEQKRAASIEKQLSGLKTNVEKQSEELKSLNNNYNEITKEIQTNTNTLWGLEANVENNTKLLNEYEGNCKNKQEELETKRSDLASLTQQIADKNKELEQVTEKLQEEQKKADPIEKQLSKLKTNVEKQSEQLKSLTERQYKIQLEIDNNTKKLGELEKDIKSKEDESQLIKDNSGKLQLDIEVQNQSLASLTQQIANKNTELEQATKKLQEEQNKVAPIEKQLCELEKNVEKQSEELKSLIECEDKIQHEIDNNTKKLGELEKDIQSNTKLLNGYQESYKDKQETLKTKGIKLSSLTQQIADKNKELGLANESLQEEQKRAASIEKQLSEIDDAIKGKTKQLNQDQEKIDRKIGENNSELLYNVKKTILLSSLAAITLPYISYNVLSYSFPNTPNSMKYLSSALIIIAGVTLMTCKITGAIECKNQYIKPLTETGVDVGVGQRGQ